MGITVEKVGRRHYLLGDTYGIKDRIKAAGGHWDGDRRAWWVAKVEAAVELTGHPSAATSEAEKAEAQRAAGLQDADKIAGKARYKGKEYLLVWEGTTSRGQAAKLAFSDGSKVFWANGGEYEVTKRYEAREYRGRSEPMTFGKLKGLRGKFQRAREQGHDDGVCTGQRYECPECGDYAIRGQGTCWETGAAH